MYGVVFQSGVSRGFHDTPGVQGCVRSVSGERPRESAASVMQRPSQTEDLLTLQADGVTVSAERQAGDYLNSSRGNSSKARDLLSRGSAEQEAEEDVYFGGDPLGKSEAGQRTSSSTEYHSDTEHYK